MHTHTHTHTIMHEGLYGPEVSIHKKASDVTGNILMLYKVRYLDLMLNLLHLLKGDGLQIDEPHHYKHTGRAMLSNQNGCYACTPNTWERDVT